MSRGPKKTEIEIRIGSGPGGGMVMMRMLAQLLIVHENLRGRSLGLKPDVDLVLVVRQHNATTGAMESETVFDIGKAGDFLQDCGC